MKAVVTGASGFLGNNLVRQLVAQGHQVTCLARPGSDTRVLDNVDVAWAMNAYQDVATLAAAVAPADVVFHCAAQVGTSNGVTANMRAANLELTDQLLAAHARQLSARLVYCSTVATCAVSEDGGDVTEEHAWNLHNYGMNNGYTQTKRSAEARVLAAAQEGVDAVVVNPCYMFGPGDSKLSSCRMILDLCNGAIPAYPPGTNNFVDVRDVARGMILAAQRGVAGQRYILGGENLPYSELFARIAAITDAAPVTRALPKGLGRVLGWFGDAKEYLTGKNSLLNSSGIAWSFADCRYSSAKAERELGYSHGNVDDAIRDAYRWFVAQGYIDSASR